MVSCVVLEYIKLSALMLKTTGAAGGAVSKALASKTTPAAVLTFTLTAPEPTASMVQRQVAVVLEIVPTDAKPVHPEASTLTPESSKPPEILNCAG